METVLEYCGRYASDAAVRYAEDLMAEGYTWGEAINLTHWDFDLTAAEADALEEDLDD